MNNKHNCSKRLVVKFGGSSLAEPDRLSKAATAVMNEVRNGTQAVIVVSAMGRTTDHLLETIRLTSQGKVNYEDLDDVLAMGERTSIRVFSAVLRSRGLKARYFDPLDQDWPIITDSCFCNATPIMELCEERIMQFIAPLFQDGIIPIIPGFIGRNTEGKTTTLGRGGSDTTAFIIASILKAEVVLVTDSDGIMTGDPKLIDNPNTIPEISIYDLIGLADSGTKFIHSKSLKYKDALIDVRVIGCKDGDLSKSGTQITGALSPNLKVELLTDSPVMAITISVKDISDALMALLNLFNEIRAFSTLITSLINHNEIILYFTEDRICESFLEKTHEIVIKKDSIIALTVRKELAVLRIENMDFESRKGIVRQISDILDRENAKLYSIISTNSSIFLFLSWNERIRIFRLIKAILEGN
jgi:aspartate kinase